MIFGLFAFLVGICLTLIVLGIYFRQHSEFSLIGFGILFILSIILLSGNLEVETGANTTTTFNYDGSGNIVDSQLETTYQYEYWNDTTSHQVGFWIAVFSAFGFIVMLYSVNRRPKDEE